VGRREEFRTGRAQLRVRNPAGDVEIEARDGEETIVELVPLNDSDATRDAIERATLRADGAQVVVEIDSGRNWTISIGNWGFGSAKVGVRIACPTGSDLQCDTASADVRAIGTFGTARVRTASGDLRVQRVDGQLELKTASGDIQVDHAEGRATVHTVSGDVLLGEILGDIDVGTVSGDALVRAAGPGELALKAVSGDVRVAIRRGLRVRLDVNSVSGKIDSELDVRDAPTRTEGPETNLRARTVSGDVKISRAAEAVA
jgi:DUF4097 and DUF4098 domain-containing protein YvlB